MNPQTIARQDRRGGHRALVALVAGAVMLLALVGATSAAAAPATGGAATTGTTTPAETAPPTSEVPTTETPATEAPAAEATEPVAKLTRAQVKRLQVKLRVRPADGVFGPRTRAAVRRFQARHHLTADGRPHLRVLTLLRIPVTVAPTAPTTTTTTAVSAPASVQPALEAAQSAIGASYAPGATGPSSFDCSGLMVYAFGKARITLPRTSFAQFNTGTEVALTEIQPGDLVFFDTAGAGASHVGIALSAETAISATTHGVMEHPIATGYWGEHLIGARRVG